MNRFLSIGIIALFIVSTVSPMAIGFKVDAVSEVAVEVEPETTITSGPMDSPWPMKCHDLHHTGRSTIGTANISYHELWQYKFSWMVDTDPAVGEDGIIYVGGSQGKLPWYLFAINPNGTLKWDYRTEGLIWLMCPSIAVDGTIYVGSWDNFLHAINPNGTRKWRFNIKDNIVSDPVVGKDGTIYFGTMGSKIFALNSNGSKKWDYHTGGIILSDPAISDDGTIYIGSDDKFLYAMNPNGTVKWKFKTGDWIHGSPSIADDGTIYISSYDDFLYALYPNGTLRWKTEKGYGSDSNPSIGSDGTIYIASINKLKAIYPYGSKKWEFKLEGSVKKSAPAICADGIIYIGIEKGDRQGGEIVAVNPNGTERWRKRLSNTWIDSSPCIGEDGIVYIVSTSGSGSTLHAFGNVDPSAPEPPFIEGPTSGKVGEQYGYKFWAYDPDGDYIYYFIEWGDGKKEEWIGPYLYGEEITVNHTWEEEGSFTIKARVKDTDNHWGPWGELEVTMPKSQNVYLDMWNRFPRLYRLIDLLNRV